MVRDRASVFVVLAIVAIAVAMELLPVGASAQARDRSQPRPLIVVDGVVLQGGTTADQEAVLRMIRPAIESIEVLKGAAAAERFGAAAVDGAIVVQLKSEFCPHGAGRRKPRRRHSHGTGRRSNPDHRRRHRAEWIDEEHRVSKHRNALRCSRPRSARAVWRARPCRCDPGHDTPDAVALMRLSAYRSSRVGRSAIPLTVRARDVADRARDRRPAVRRMPTRSASIPARA